LERIGSQGREMAICSLKRLTEVNDFDFEVDVDHSVVPQRDTANTPITTGPTRMKTPRAAFIGCTRALRLRVGID